MAKIQLNTARKNNHCWYNNSTLDAVKQNVINSTNLIFL